MELDLDFLAARRFAYAAFQRLLGDRPTLELFNALDIDVLSEALAIVGVAHDESETLRALLNGASAKIDALETEYARIFVGPSALPAPPWESVYAGKRRLVMTEDTLAVRNAYREQGFEPALGRRVPDDHIAIELDFLANLAARALDAAQQGKTAEHAEALDASEAFLANHLTQWVGDFILDLDAHAESEFYTGIATAVRAFAAADLEALKD